MTDPYWPLDNGFRGGWPRAGIAARPSSSGGRLQVVTPPAAEPVTKADLYGPLKVVTNGTSPDTSDDDAYLDMLIAAWRQRAEEVELYRALITQTWDMKLDRFPGDGTAIVLPRPPLQSVTSITYIDAAGVQQTLSTDVYQVYTATFERGYAALKYGQAWPTTRDIQEAVTVRFVAGYGPAPGDVPAAIRDWLTVCIGRSYEFREAVVTGTIATQLGFVDHLLGPYRLTGGAA